MDSKEINKRIRELEDLHNKPFEAFGGKAIPYIGWFWRDVNFDAERCDFGVITGCNKCDDPPMVGFMQNNKWGYDYVLARGDQWVTIKTLIVAALEDSTADTLKAVDDAIQGLVAGEHSAYSRGGG